MMNFTLILVLLFTFGWITKSDFEFHSVVVQPNEEVTLLCSNFSKFPQHIFWYKLTDGPNISRISAMQSSESEAKDLDGFNHDKFNMTSNGTKIFLNIKQVNFSDSGVYICGKNSDKCWNIFSATHLQIEGVIWPKWESEPKSKEIGCNYRLGGFNEFATVILGSVVIFLVTVIIGLVWKIKTFNTAQANRRNQKHNENLDSDALNYTVLHFRPKTNNNIRPSAEREPDQNVLYATTR